MTEGRREPAWDGGPGRDGFDLRVTADDRPGLHRPVKPRRASASAGQTRREPSFAPHVAPGDDPLAGARRRRTVSDPGDEDAKPMTQGSSRPRAPEDDEDTDAPKRPRRKRRRSRRRRHPLRRALYWGAVATLWAAIALVGFVAWHASKLPPIDQLAVPKRPPNIAIIAADGALLANRGETGGRNVALKELPPYLPRAFVAIEDHRFYDHSGIDPLGIARALVRNLTRSGGGMQGGSTLTQQLAKNLFLTQERTASRKVQEAILALWLERNYSKDQVLELYLNRVYFGSGAYGVEAAAQKYFGKSARAVTLSEAAILAGLVQAPSRLAPNRNPDAANARGALVIAAMAREGLITDDMAKIALMNPPVPARNPGAGSVNYAADYVMDALDDYIGPVDRDVVVTTTLDSGLQNAAERALVEELATKGETFGVSQGAFVAMQPDGALRAMVGGRNYADSQFNRAAAARRQPGSAFKPFVYLTALEHGLTPDTIREDAPINVKGWQPENYSRDYRGPVSLRTALALSLNTVAVRLGVEVGPKAVAQTAHRLGITSKLEPNASIALGTSEVTPIELVTAYAPFANGGVAVLPYVIRQVKTTSGQVLYSRSGPGLGRVVDPQIVGMMNAMMRETLLTGTARKAEMPGWEAAGKTGTSQDFRDAWFVGYTGTLLAGVWLGNDDGAPTKKTTGGTLPVEIWSRFMKTALAGQPATPLPGGPSVPLSPAPPSDAPIPAVTRATGASPIVIGPPPPAPGPGTTAPLPPARQAVNDGTPRPPGNVTGGPAPARAAPPAGTGGNALTRLFGGG